MKTGIVSRCKGENTLFNKIKVFKLNDKIAVAQIPFSKNDKRKKEKAQKKLKRLGADNIIYEKDLKETPFDTSLVFYKLAPKAVLVLTRKFNIKTPFYLSIKQKNPDHRALHVITELIYEAKSVSILSDETEEVLKIQSKIMDEYGAVLECLPYNFCEKEEVCINLDKSEITIGRWTMKDFAVEIDTFGYNLDTLELFYMQNENFNDAVIKSCICGKNKLTLTQK